MFMKTNNMINNFSVVIPVFNEEEIFIDSAKKIYNICNEVNKPFEIIFSENGSTDNTVNLIQNFINDKDNCFMIRNEIANYGLALKNGFRNAKNDLIISFDIDYFSQKFLVQSLKLTDEFVGIVASKRMSESEDERTIVRKLATSTFVLILKFLFQTSLSEVWNKIFNMNTKVDVASFLTIVLLSSDSLILLEATIAANSSLNLSD